MPKVFISYSHQDAKHLKNLQQQLAAINRHQPIGVRVASDQELKAGDLWRQEILSYLSEADAVVFLVSAAFLDSDMCLEELDYVRQNQPDRPMLVALVGSTNIDLVPDLTQSQFLNKAKVVGYKDWARVAKEIYTNVLERSQRKDKEGDRAGSVKPSWALVKDAVQAGNFTPVLGPGCYQLPENQRRGKDLVRARVEAIGAQCGGGKARSYLEGVVSSKMPDILRHEGSARPYSATPGGLLELQSALAELGAACCLQMSEAMRVESRGFTRVRTLSTPIAADAHIELRQSFFVATHRAFDLMHGAIESLRDLGLGGRGILERLIALTYVIFYAHLTGPRRDLIAERWTDKYNAYLPKASGLVQGDQPMGTLSFAQVEWIGNLLWHTIRFDVPMYPTLEELAFQLSLCVDDPMLPRRERATTMAELADWSSRAELIPKWYRRYAPKSYAGTDHSFYDSLARALIVPRTLPAPAHAPRKTPAPFKGNFRDAVDLHLNSVAVAITTNLDYELEGALERLREPYEVVFPVWVTQERKAGEREIPKYDWLLRRVEPDGETSFRVEERLLGRCGLDDEVIASVLNGPLIVKLHGSPLHKLPRPSQLEGGCTHEEGASCSLQHRFALSDADFVNAIVLRDRFRPPGLQGLFKNGRLLCFLGLPLSDLYSRFALYDHLGSETSGVHLLWMDSPRDAVRHRLLVEIKVDLVEASFQDLMNRLNDWLASPELAAGGRR